MGKRGRCCAGFLELFVWTDFAGGIQGIFVGVFNEKKIRVKMDFLRKKSQGSV